MYFYCHLTLFSKLSVKVFGPGFEMIYLSQAEWTKAHFLQPKQYFYEGMGLSCHMTKNKMLFLSLHAILNIRFQHSTDAYTFQQQQFL